MQRLASPLRRRHAIRSKDRAGPAGPQWSVRPRARRSSVGRSRRETATSQIARDELVCFPFQPGRCLRQRFSITAAVSTNTLTSRPIGRQPPRQRLQPAGKSIISPGGIDRNRAAFALFDISQRDSSAGPVMNAEHDHRAHPVPQQTAKSARRAGGPRASHVAMRAGLEEACEMLAAPALHLSSHQRQAEADAPASSQARPAASQGKLRRLVPNRGPRKFDARHPRQPFAHQRPERRRDSPALPRPCRVFRDLRALPPR